MALFNLSNIPTIQTGIHYNFYLSPMTMDLTLFMRKLLSWTFSAFDVNISFYTNRKFVKMKDAQVDV